MSGKLMVRSLPWSVRDGDLAATFERFGEMRECKVIMDRQDPGRSRGFGFVTFVDPSCAARALEELDNSPLENRTIRVQYADGDRGGSGHGQGSGAGYSNREGRNDRHGDSRHRERDRSPGRERDSYRDRDRERDRFQRSGSYHSRGGDRDGSGMGTNGAGGGVRRKMGGGADEMNDPENQSARIYITGLPADTTEDELAETFGMLGKVDRKRQKGGFPDQWPWKVSIYRDDAGKPKGDATLTYVDPNAAQRAPEFFNGTEFKGSKITCEMAAAAKAPANDGNSRGGGRGGWGGGGGGGGSYNRGGGGYRGGGGNRRY